MEIVDINFNFDDLEKLVKAQRMKCSLMLDALEELVDMHNDLFEDAEPAQENKNAEQTLVYKIIQTLELVNAEVDKFTETIDLYVATMHARITFIEKTNTKEQIKKNEALFKELCSLTAKVEKSIWEKEELTDAIADLNTDIWGEDDMDLEDDGIEKFDDEPEDFEDYL